MWILFQSLTESPRIYKCYAWDGPAGMKATLEAAKDIIASLPPSRPTKAELIGAFLSIQNHLMRYGSTVQNRRVLKSKPTWVGDKKPVQQADPQIRKFMKDLFSESHYLHVIRHPAAVIASMQRAAYTWRIVPDYWKSSPKELLKRWLHHENWVIQAKAEQGHYVHSLRYEDLLADPVGQTRKCYDFLNVGLPEELVSEINKTVKPRERCKNSITAIAAIDGLEEVMSLYGYEPDGTVIDVKSSQYNKQE